MMFLLLAEALKNECKSYQTVCYFIEAGGRKIRRRKQPREFLLHRSPARYQQDRALSAIAWLI